MKRRDKKTVLIAMIIVTLGFGGTRAKAKNWTPDNKAQARRLEAAWKMVYFVESTSGTNPKAYTENSCRALGGAQIRPIMIREVNRILGYDQYELKDRMNDTYSKHIFFIVCKHHYPNGSVELLCRFWLRWKSHKRQYDKHGDAYWAMCVAAPK